MTENAAFCPSCGRATAQANSAPAGTAAPPAATPGQANYASTADAATPLAENVAGMLAYFTIIPAIIFLLIEPYNRNRFVRFHCFQCLFAVVALIAIHIALLLVLGILHFVPIIGTMLTLLIYPLLGLAELALWILLVIKAYQGQMFKLPIIGDAAEKQAGA
jgi:uncharacterized membrane protein